MPDINSKEISWKGELLRKLTHLFALIIPLGYYYLDLSKWQMLAIMIPVTLCILIVDISRLLDWRLWRLFRGIVAPMIRRNETAGEDFTGAAYILTASCFVIGLFSQPVAVLSLAFIIIGDPAAAIIGRKYGRHRFKNKSLEGSLAFFLAACLPAVAAPGIPLIPALSAAAVATVTEALSFQVDDNTTVPLISGLYLTLLLKILNV